MGKELQNADSSSKSIWIKKKKSAARVKSTFPIHTVKIPEIANFKLDQKPVCTVGLFLTLSMLS